MIIENFSHALLPNYRLHVLRYLNTTHAFEEYIDLYIEEYKLTEGYFNESTIIHSEILDVFTKCLRSDSLYKIIKAVTQHTHTYSNYVESYEIIISNAVKAYNNGNTEMLDCIVKSFIDADMHNKAFARKIRELKKR